MPLCRVSEGLHCSLILAWMGKPNRVAVIEVIAPRINFPCGDFLLGSTQQRWRVFERFPADLIVDSEILSLELDHGGISHTEGDHHQLPLLPQHVSPLHK